MKNYQINKNLWLHDENLIYLNNGSFGSTPKPVMEHFIELNRQMERNLMQFYLVEYPKLMSIARKEISSFLNANENNMAFVENATTGVNAVLRSLENKIDSSWEILTVNHYYPAIKNTLNYIAEQKGCKIVVADLPDYVESAQQIIDIVKSAINENTKMVVIDHITSISGIVIPVKEIIETCRKNNILILIDGAHSAGFLDLDLNELNADWFTGNLHKWLFAPKGTAFLHTADLEKYEIHPPVISNNYKSGYTNEFDWTGTKNFCGWLSVPESIKFYNEHFDKQYVRELSLYARQLLQNELGLQPMADESVTGLMQSFWLPDTAGNKIEDVLKLRQELLTKHNIEIFMYPFKGRIILRTSSQIYNTPDEYEILGRALGEILQVRS